MSEGYSGGMPAQPPVSAPPRRGGIPTWLIIVIIVLVLCALVLGIVLCVLPTLGLTLAGPAIQGAFSEVIAGLGCQVENPSIDSETCTNWATNLSENYSSEMDACQSIVSGNDNSTDTASRYYNCLIDEGVPPPE